MAASRGCDGLEDTPFPEPSGTPGTPRVQPYPDELLGDLADCDQGPDAKYAPRESMSLAFVTALQHLPPRRRAALILRDVLGFQAAEAADILDCDTEALDDALADARSVLAHQLPPGWRDQAPLPGSVGEREIAARFADAFQRGDADGIAALLTEDAWLTAPPLPFGYRGRSAAEFLSVVPFRGGTRRVRLIATRANGQPAFGCYLSDPAAPICHAHGLIVLTLDGDRVSGITRFIDNSVLTRFGLPRTLPD